MNSEMSLDTPATDINKVCASGMKSVMMAAQAIRCGDRNIMLAGGMECMSKAPHYKYLRRPYPFGETTLVDSIKLDGFTDVYNNILMGGCVEKNVKEIGISR